MEKKTILAIVLSTLVLVVFYGIQLALLPPQQGQFPPEQEQTVIVQENSRGEQPSAAQMVEIPAEETLVAQQLEIDTKLLHVTLTNMGGDIISYQLKNHKDGDTLVEMVLQGNRESHAFTVALGSLQAEPLNFPFHVRRLSEYSVEFFRDFSIDGQLFHISKKYDFRPEEYMFELTVTLSGDNSIPTLNFGGVSYTLGFGPQIGPRFDVLDQRSDYRNYFSYTNGKRKQERVNNSSQTIINNHPTWAAIAGKYFTLVAIPYPTQYDLIFSTATEPGLSSSSRLFVTRPVINSSRTEDVYRFYLGPKNQEDLAVYNTGANSFGLLGTDLIKVADTSGILAPVETALKWILQLFYRIIPNYGIAIIFTVLIVKVLFFPLTKKGSESTLRMQALSPKIKEIQTKHKNNPQKMNTEMAELYKAEGYNPLSGCLPMLLQIPIFFAMYNLFNTHFDLRGAMFIPGWIPDLSIPESIWNFAPIKIPLLGWSDIRLLPFIYLASQLLYGKVTQTPDQQGNAQMKMILFAMPIMFFFVLYNVPSGLLVYWIMSNILTLVQQILINKFIAKQKAKQSIPIPIIHSKVGINTKKKRKR
ncbi:MAG: membrane protein insertase YidC [Treponema sp.]|jgi:YidC/Oxa1 family membrane protein insertase|nr:membrane protein insertase YidC [Treponema sp.]